MLEKIKDEKYRSISTPCKEVIEQLKEIKSKIDTGISVAEIGVGIGATTAEIIKVLDNKDNLFLFSFEEDVNELKEDLEKINYNNVKIIACGNSHCTLDSYSWQLAKLAKAMQEQGKNGEFDLAYLDGAHMFFHDAVSVCLLKLLCKPNGIIILDDLYWTIDKSPTNRVEVKPINAKLYTKEQMETPNIDLVCKIFMDSDKEFFRIESNNKSRAVYKKNDIL